MQQMLCHTLPPWWHAKGGPQVIGFVSLLCCPLPAIVKPLAFSVCSFSGGKQASIFCASRSMPRKVNEV